MIKLSNRTWAICSVAIAFAFPGEESQAEQFSFSMAAYNSRLVLGGSALLGAAAGAIGSLMLLRRKALFGDAVSHAMLPGIVTAFLLANAAGYDGKSMSVLLMGGGGGAVAGLLAIHGIRRATRLPDDAALAIVLSVFYGAGIALLGVVQQLEGVAAAGLEHFLYGKAASLLAEDLERMTAVAALIAATTVLFFKEFRLLCFDPDFARAQGWPVRTLDALMTSLVLATAVVGAQAVGLILIVAYLIIPAAAARFWTRHLQVFVLLSAALGAVAGAAGSYWSASVPDWPTGAVIVLSAAALFFVSFLFGADRGLLPAWWRAWLLERRIARQHALRALYETEERIAAGEARLAARVWRRTARQPLISFLRARCFLHRKGYVTKKPGGWALTERGREEAASVVRRHRLWELYLMRFASVSADQVDRDADAVEHVLTPEMVDALEKSLQETGAPRPPPSPHPLNPPPESR